MSGLKSKFVSEEEVKEEREKRQADWERVRQPDDPKECPEEETRSLFEQLEANKDFTARELEEENKLRSSVKGLDDDEVQFLNFVSNRQMQIEKDRNNEEKSVIQQLKEKSQLITVEDKQKQSSSGSSSSSSVTSSSSAPKKSQQQLLSGAIKRKSTDSKPGMDEKKAKSESEEQPDAKLIAGLPPSNGVMQVAGILPGIAGYDDDDSSTENSSNSSDSEADHKIEPSAPVVKILQDIAAKLKEQNQKS